GEPLDERVMDRFVEQEAGRGGAALPGRTECAPEHSVEGEIQAGVRHDDLCVLSTHFQRQPLVHLATYLTDRPTGSGRTGEGNDGNRFMGDERRPDLFTVSVDEVDDTRRDAR